MERALAGKTAWVSGLRRADSPSRADDADRARRPAARGHQDQPDRHVDRRGRRALQGDGAAARAPARRARLPVDRLLAVHPPGRAGRGRPRPGAGPAAARPSAACTSSAPRRRRSATAMSVEDIKRASGFLRGELAERARRRHRRASAHDSTVLLKFHGIYQQDDRDVRRERASQKLPLDYSCMVRASVPGRRADRRAVAGPRPGRRPRRRHDAPDDPPGRAVPRRAQGRAARARRAASTTPLLTTLAACGDVVRNVMGSPWPDERQAVLEPLVDALVARFRPQTASYWELWVDGEKAVTAAAGAAAVPRARRAASARPSRSTATSTCRASSRSPWPGRATTTSTCSPTTSASCRRSTDGLTGDVTGYNVYVGGGLGHEPRPRGRHLPAARRSRSAGSRRSSVVDVVEAVVTTQRDFGNREDRHRARLKYLVEERGHRVDARRGRPAGRVRSSTPPAELPPWVPEEYHGTRDGVIGLPVPSGKIADRDGVAPAHRAARAGRRRHGHPDRASPPARTCCCSASRRAASARSRTACGRTACRSPATSARCAGWPSPARRCRRAARRSARPSGCCPTS